MMTGKRMKLPFILPIMFLAGIVSIKANAQTSVYTTLDFEKGCTILSEHEIGLTALCQGYTGYPVIFAEGDLRHMVRFGHVAEIQSLWQSFGEFNHVNNTIEWRLRDKKPVAAILRWFIENSSHDGQYKQEIKGQVLVVSTVGTHERPTSCVVGYVDARANEAANKMAQEIADTRASTFECGKDKPEFYGSRGKYSGTPTAIFE
jgi:hypothetical protein